MSLFSFNPFSSEEWFVLVGLKIASVPTAIQQNREMLTIQIAAIPLPPLGPLYHTIRRHCRPPPRRQLSPAIMGEESTNLECGGGGREKG
jgi:hypothetical protein